MWINFHAFKQVSRSSLTIVFFRALWNSNQYLHNKHWRRESSPFSFNPPPMLSNVSYFKKQYLEIQIEYPTVLITIISGEPLSMYTNTIEFTGLIGEYILLLHQYGSAEHDSSSLAAETNQSELGRFAPARTAQLQRSRHSLALSQSTPQSIGKYKVNLIDVPHFSRAFPFICLIHLRYSVAYKVSLSKRHPPIFISSISLFNRVLISQYQTATIISLPIFIFLFSFSFHEIILWSSLLT